MDVYALDNVYLGMVPHAAIVARFLLARKAEHGAAAAVFGAPPAMERTQLVGSVRAALYVARVALEARPVPWAPDLPPH